MGSHWEETKKSIRDARYRLSLSTNSEILDTKNNVKINEVSDYKVRLRGSFNFNMVFL